MLTSLFVFGILSYVEIALAKPWNFHYGGSSSVVERQIVDLVVEGSRIWLSRVRIPSSTQNLSARSSTDRASDFESAGYRFESCRAHKTFGPLAQLVEQQTLNLRVKGSIPLRLINIPSTTKVVINCESGGIGIHASLRN